MHPADVSTGAGGSVPLARFQSAPATWLEALLESDDDVIINPEITTSFVDSSLVLPVTGGEFLRQNSLPEEFLAQINTDGIFTDYGIPVKGRYDTLEESGMKFTIQLSGDQSGLLDAEMEKMLEDSVPFKVRAKRGFATHPRSIAERVRRTRISDRIRKLQELVPNMDKQTNTADMLGEAVEYVKFLQRQIQDLTEHQNKCTCSVKA